MRYVLLLCFFSSSLLAQQANDSLLHKSIKLNFGVGMVDIGNENNDSLLKAGAHTIPAVYDFNIEFAWHIDRKFALGFGYKLSYIPFFINGYYITTSNNGNGCQCPHYTSSVNTLFTEYNNHSLGFLINYSFLKKKIIASVQGELGVLVIRERFQDKPYLPKNLNSYAGIFSNFKLPVEYPVSKLVSLGLAPNLSINSTGPVTTTEFETIPQSYHKFYWFFEYFVEATTTFLIK